MNKININDIEYLEKVNETALEYKDQDKLSIIKNAARKRIEDKLGSISELKKASNDETELNHLINVKHKIQNHIFECKEEIELLELINTNLEDDIAAIEISRSDLLQKLNGESENELHPRLQIDKAYRIEKQNQLINNGKVGNIKRAE